MQWERITRPQTLPVSDTALSDHLRIEGQTDLLAIAQRQALAATYDIEDHAEIALITQSIRVTFTYPKPLMDNVTLRKAWCLPIGPVFNATTITGSIISSDGVVAIFAPAQIKLTGFTRPVFHIIDDGNLPDLLRHCNARLVVEYDAGYGATEADIPADLGHAVMDQASLFFDAGYDLRRGHTGLSPHTARIAARYRGVRI